MALTESIGGIPALAAVLVVLTGILGSVIVTPLMNALRIRDYAARGFAVGVASHGIGTARAFQVSEEAGTFAGIAMGLNGALTALVFALFRSSCKRAAGLIPRRAPGRIPAPSEGPPWRRTRRNPHRRRRGCAPAPTSAKTRPATSPPASRAARRHLRDLPQDQELPLAHVAARTSATSTCCSTSRPTRSSR